MDQDSNAKEDAATLNLLTEDTTEKDGEDEQQDESKSYESPSSSDLSYDNATETNEDEQLGEPEHYGNATSSDLLTRYKTEGDDDEWSEEQERYEDMWGSSNLLTADYATEKDEDEQSIVHESDSGRIRIANGIERVEELRLEQTNLIARRTNVMKMLVELYEKNLCKPNVPTIEGTADEVEEFYNEQLLDFNRKKIMALERKHILQEEMKLNAEIVRSKRNECAVISERQYDLELKNAVGWINTKTRQPLTEKNVEKMLKTHKLKKQQLIEFRLKFITAKNKCNHLLKGIDIFESNKINITKYLIISDTNSRLKQLIEHKDKEINKNRNTIIKTLEIIKNISKRMDDLMTHKETDEAKLKEIKEEWRRNVNVKAHNQTVSNRKKKKQRSDLFTEYPLLSVDYHTCVEKADANKAVVAELNQKLSDCNEELNKLRSTYEMAIMINTQRSSSGFLEMSEL